MMPAPIDIIPDIPTHANFTKRSTLSQTTDNRVAWESRN